LEHHEIDAEAGETAGFAGRGPPTRYTEVDYHSDGNRRTCFAQGTRRWSDLSVIRLQPRFRAEATRRSCQ